MPSATIAASGRIDYCMNGSLSPNWLEINLSVMADNIRAVRSLTAVEVMAVIKADAYGYGTVPAAQAAVKGGAAWLGTARTDEAILLRAAGITLPMLILGMIPFAQIDSCISHNISLPVSSFEVVDLYNRRAAEMGKPLHVHLKVDTGMGRLGIFAGQALSLARYILQQPMLFLEGLFSHLANADLQDDPSVFQQIDRFNEALNALESADIHPRWVHLANTAAALTYPTARFNLVRGGQFLVGHNSFSDRPLHPQIRRALHAWKASLLACQFLPAGSQMMADFGFVPAADVLVGLVSVGYADGFWRQAGNQVLVGGKRQMVAGLPGPDSLLVHLDQPYPPGSEVALVGTQGLETITIQDLAVWWKTGPGKITSVIPGHVPRLYFEDR